MEAMIRAEGDGIMNVIRRERVDEKRESPPQLLYTTNELASVMGVKPLTIRRWTKAGVIPVGIDIGGVKRWRRDEIQAWIQSGSPPQK